MNFPVDHINKRLARIFDRCINCNFNKSSINPAKSKFMITSNTLIKTSPILYLGRDRIICRSSVKYLGLLIDCNLKFSFDVIHVKTKVSRFAGNSARNKTIS